MAWQEACTYVGKFFYADNWKTGDVLLLASRPNYDKLILLSSLLVSLRHTSTCVPIWKAAKCNLGVYNLNFLHNKQHMLSNTAVMGRKWRTLLNSEINKQYPFRLRLLKEERSTASSLIVRSYNSSRQACMSVYVLNKPLLCTLSSYVSYQGWRFVSSYWRDALWPRKYGVLRRHIYLATVNALTIVGNNLPMLLAIAIVEFAGGVTSKAEAFQYYLNEDEASTAHPFTSLVSNLVAAVMGALRLLVLLALFAPVALTAPLALRLDWLREEWMELVRKTLEKAGPAFIKWGQWAATRHDIFPPDFCSALEKLHSHAPVHGFRHTRKAIEASFGMKLEQIFESFSDRPVASGSIGQVHQAVLGRMGAAVTGFEAGSLVAVKVRHPGVGSAILRDFQLMMWIACIAEILPGLQGMRLEETLKQFAAPLREQVDLAREASNLSRFNYNFRHSHHVDFPVPLYPLVADEVLVESYEAGEPITRYLSLERGPYNHRLSELGSGTMLQMMLVDNLIHSDLHPGNILVRLERPEGITGIAYSIANYLRKSSFLSAVTRARISNLLTRWRQPKLILLDVGMATELSEDDRQNMVQLFRSFAAYDGEGVASAVLAFSGIGQTCPHPEAFKAELVVTFDAIRTMDEVGAGWSSTKYSSSADALAGVLDSVRRHAVILPGHICAVVVTTLVLEGWSNKLDPEHSVLTQVQAMFEATNLPWRERMGRAVDTCMDREGTLCIP